MDRQTKLKEELGIKLAAKTAEVNARKKRILEMMEGVENMKQ